MARSSRYDSDSVKPKGKKGSKDRPRKLEGLVNARLLAFEFPDTFETPSDADIKKIKPGDFVKVCRNNERFWIRVDGFVGRKWHGTIDNDLGLNPDLACGESIFFMRKHIYDVLKG
jgi:hypothetical protein